MRNTYKNCLIVVAALALFLSSCDVSKKSSDGEETGERVESEGVVTQTILAGSGANQLINAGSTSNIAGASVMFPALPNLLKLVFER